MSPQEPASATTIGRLSCRFALPRDAAPRGELYWRLEQVLNSRLTDALARALSALDDTDPDTVWVVRSLRADITVSGESEDLDGLAGQWGSQLALAIIARLGAGPGGEVVRYASPAEHLAHFVVALASGRADSWMFEPFAGLRQLRPLAALRSGARTASSAVTSVVAALIHTGRLEAVLASASEAELVRVWDDCVESARATAPASAELATQLRVLATERLAAEILTASPAALGLRLVAAASERYGSGPELFASAALVVAGAPGIAVIPGSPGGEPPATLPDGRRPGPAAALGADGPVARPIAQAIGRGGATRVFAARGAPAFMLLRSLERIGLQRANADVRAAVLASALGCDGDEAVMLAAGTDGPRSPQRPDGVELLGDLRVALAEDGRIDGRWLLAERAVHPDGTRHVGLIRDVATDLWLAGVVRRRAGDIPWGALIDEVAADLGRPPGLVLGQHQAVSLAHTDGLSRALGALRPAGADLTWLDPADDDWLAAGLAGRAMLGDLSRRLLGFDRSSLSYLVERFLPLGGIVTAGDRRIQVELPPAQLSVILVMAGLERFAYTVPWLAQEVSVVHRAG